MILVDRITDVMNGVVDVCGVSSHEACVRARVVSDSVCHERVLSIETSKLKLPASPVDHASTRQAHGLHVSYNCREQR